MALQDPTFRRLAITRTAARTALDRLVPLSMANSRCSHACPPAKAVKTRSTRNISSTSSSALKGPAHLLDRTRTVLKATARHNTRSHSSNKVSLPCDSRARILRPTRPSTLGEPRKDPKDRKGMPTAMLLARTTLRLVLKGMVSRLDSRGPHQRFEPVSFPSTPVIKSQ